MDYATCVKNDFFTFVKVQFEHKQKVYIKPLHESYRTHFSKKLDRLTLIKVI